MSKPKFTTVEKVPNWAACWFANGDDSGLTEEDKALIAGYEKRLASEGLTLVAPIEGTESEFEPYPAFGLGLTRGGRRPALDDPVLQVADLRPDPLRGEDLFGVRPRVRLARVSQPGPGAEVRPLAAAILPPRAL